MARIHGASSEGKRSASLKQFGLNVECGKNLKKKGKIKYLKITQAFKKNLGYFTHLINLLISTITTKMYFTTENSGLYLIDEINKVLNKIQKKLIELFTPPKWKMKFI